MSVAHDIMNPLKTTNTKSRTLFQGNMASEFWMNLAGKDFRLVGKTIRIGRALDNDIILDHKSVSRYHALLTISNDRVILEDLKSRNGIKVNSVPVKRVELKDNDPIRIGDLYGLFFERSNKKKSARAASSSSSQGREPSMNTAEREEARASLLLPFDQVIQTIRLKIDSLDLNDAFENLKEKKKVVALVGMISVAALYLMTMSSGGRRPAQMVEASMIPASAAEQILESARVTPKELERCTELEDLGNYRQAVTCLKSLPATQERNTALERVQNAQREFVDKRFLEGQQAFDNYYYDLAILKFQEVALVADENSDVLVKALSNIAIADERRKVK